MTMNGPDGLKISSRIRRLIKKTTDLGQMKTSIRIFQKTVKLMMAKSILLNPQESCLQSRTWNSGPWIQHQIGMRKKGEAVVVAVVDPTQTAPRVKIPPG